MKKSRILSLALSAAMLASSFTSMNLVSAAPLSDADLSEIEVSLNDAQSTVYDFTTMTAVPTYSSETGYGFESITSSYASKVTAGADDVTEGTGRSVAPVESITIGTSGASVTESTGAYLHNTNSSNYNYGGLVFRADVAAAGAYRVVVEGIDGTAKDNTSFAVSGTQASRLTGTKPWDSAGLVAKNTYAAYDGATWTYDFVASEGYIEIEAEPAKLPTEAAPATVGIKKVTITPIEKAAATDTKPTVFVLGDSTQKTYTFEENSMSGYGQVINQMFDLSKVNVVNYSMGGRSMKANYQEGRFDDILMTAKPGDYVLIHSAHNDESVGNSAGPEARFGRGSNTATYTNWLNKIYIPSMKAMGITPVLVSGMPRTTDGVVKKGFNPDSPAIMKAAADADAAVEYIDLFGAASEYISAIGAAETTYIYQSLEAGETAGKTNSGSYANGHPDNKIDGTHYKEAYAKQLSRMIAQSIYDQKLPLADALADNVKAACADGEWVEHVFPEMANDVSTIGNTKAAATSQGTNAYYRNQIEKMLQLGVMAKDEKGNFYPNDTMTVGGFATALTELWGLDKAVLSNYTEVIDATEAPATETPTEAPSEAPTTAPSEAPTTAPSETPSEAPTTAPSEVPTTEPTTAPTAEPVPAVAVTATYADGRLVSLETAAIQYTEGMKIDVAANQKVFVWDSLTSMKPLCAPITAAAKESVSLNATGETVKYAVPAGAAITAGMTATAGSVTMTFGNDPEYKVTDYAGLEGYTTYASGKGNPKDDGGAAYSISGNVPTNGTYYVFNPTEEGEIKVAVVLNGGKPFYILEDGKAMEGYDGMTEAAKVYTSYAFRVQPNKTYYVFCQGSKLGCFGFEFTPGPAPTPTPAPTVDPNKTPEPAVVAETKISADAALTREAMAAIVYDAYLAKFGKSGDEWNKPVYMTAYNGTNLSPDDPNYDPNLTGKSSQYYPLVGWGALTDTDKFETSLYGKAKEVYNLGLMRSEKGIARGKMVCGTEMEPKANVTRAKAAKELYFLYNLIQDKLTENQTIPNGKNMAFEKTEALVTPNPTKPSYPGGSAVVPTVAPTGAPATVEPTTAPTVEPTVAPTLKPGELPADIVWRADDAAFDNALAVTAPTTVNGLTVYPNWKGANRTASYTHTDGTEYTFTRAWQGGTGSLTNRSLSFQPEQACVVTVVFDGNGAAGRTQTIEQNGVKLNTVASESGVTVLTADVEDPTYPVYIYGGGSNKNTYAVFVEYYDPTVVVYQNISGKLTYSGKFDLTDKNIVFTNTETKEAFKIKYTPEYTISLPQRSTYEVTVEGLEAEVCATLDTKTVAVHKADKTQDINLVDIVDTEVKGEVVTHGLDMSGVTLTFTAKDDASIVRTATIGTAESYELPTATNTMSVVLTPNHEYTVTAAGNDGYTLSPLSQSYVMVAGETNPFKNILFTKDLGTVEYKAEVTVGKGKDYETLTEAVAAVKAMTTRPMNESGRVTILVEPGAYCEQVTIDSPFVTLKAADEANKPTITWYYGVGYLYYSADKGYFNEDNYVQRTDYGTVTKWGCTVRVTGKNFIAENIIFENSFNCRVTDEELKDGVKAADTGWYADVAGKPDRTVAGYDAKAKPATERAAAMAAEGANSEFFGCEFISSQDTLYTGSNTYFKDCYIEGGTDYIFGGNSVVFDGCTLAWHGYSDQTVGGYITACKTSAKPEAGVSSLNSNGYYFENCKVANSKYYPDNKFAAGSWGRNWGGANCQVVFKNTTMDGVDVPGAWVKMGGELNTSIIYVDGVTDKTGAAVTDLSKVNPNGTMEANGYTPLTMLDYFGEGWIPVHYDGYRPVVTPEPDGALKLGYDFLNLSAQNILTADEIAGKTKVSFGLTADGVRVAADSADAAVVFENVKYHSEQHGMNPGTMKVKVPTYAKVAIGTCAWGSEATLKVNGEVVDKKTTNTGACFSGVPTENVVYLYYREDKEAELEISGGSYWPYIGVQTITADELPSNVDVTFSLGESTAAGTAPETITVEQGQEITIPVNRTVYLEGSTLTGWTDGTKTYKAGEKVAVNESITLTAVFTANTKTTENEYSVTWDFQTQTGAPTLNVDNAKDAVYVTQVDIDGEKQDVAMYYSGSMTNASWKDWVSVTAGMTFLVPVIDNSVVTVGDTYYQTEAYTIGTESFTGSNGQATISTAGMATIEVTNSGFFRSITVLYPGTKAVAQDAFFNFSPAQNGFIESKTAAATDYAFQSGAVVFSKNTVYNNDHGVYLPAGDSIKIAAGGPMLIALGSCQYSGATITLKGEDGSVIATKEIGKNNTELAGQCGKNDSSVRATFSYTGEGEILTINSSAGIYLPFVEIVNSK